MCCGRWTSPLPPRMARSASSLSRETTEAEIDHVLKVMPEIIAGLRTMSPFWSEAGAKPDGFNPEYA